MDVSKRTVTNNFDAKKAQVTEAATDLLDEGKKYAHELYEDGLEKAEQVKKEAQVYTDELLMRVREHPMKSILIAGGIGMLLSALLRK